METTKKISFPRWATILYIILAVVQVPWIFSLAANLPSRHLANHWDAVWVGFDIIMLVTLALTILFIIKNMVWVVMSATALATLFVVDAWFDILTSKPGHEQRVAIFFGSLEVVLAALTYRLIFHVIHHSDAKRSVRLVAER